MGLGSIFNKEEEQKRLAEIERLEKELAALVDKTAHGLAEQEAEKEAVLEWLFQEKKNIVTGYTGLYRTLLSFTDDDADFHALENQAETIVEDHEQTIGLILKTPYNKDDENPKQLGSLIDVLADANLIDYYGSFSRSIRKINRKNKDGRWQSPAIKERATELKEEMIEPYKREISFLVKDPFEPKQSETEESFFGALSKKTKESQADKIEELKKAIAKIEEFDTQKKSKIDNDYNATIDVLEGRIAKVAQGHFALMDAVKSALPEETENVLRNPVYGNIKELVLEIGVPIYEHPDMTFAQLALETSAGDGEARAAVYKVLIEHGATPDFKAVLKQALATEDPLTPGILKKAVLQYAEDVDKDQIKEELFFSQLTNDGLPALASAISNGGVDSDLVQTMLGLLQYDLESATILRRVADMVKESRPDLAQTMSDMADNVAGTYVPFGEAAVININALNDSDSLAKISANDADLTQLSKDYLASRPEFVVTTDKGGSETKISNLNKTAAVIVSDIHEKSAGRPGKGWEALEDRMINTALIDNAWLENKDDGSVDLKLMINGQVGAMNTNIQNAEAFFDAVTADGRFVRTGTEILNIETVENIWFKPEEDEQDKGTIQFASAQSHGCIAMDRRQAEAFISRLEKEKGFFCVTNTECLNPSKVQGMWVDYDQDTGDVVLKYALSGVEAYTKGLDNEQARAVVDNFVNKQDSGFIQLANYDYSRVQAMDIVIYDTENKALRFTLSGQPWSNDADEAMAKRVMREMDRHPEQFMKISENVYMNMKTLIKAWYDDNQAGLDYVLIGQNGDLPSIKMDRDTAQTVIDKMVAFGRDKKAMVMPSVTSEKETGQQQKHNYPGQSGPS